MSAKPETVDQYLEQVAPERREAIVAVRDAVRKGLHPGYEEGIQYGMLAWYVPHSVYPNGYHCDRSQPVPFAALASQKAYMSLYLFCIYTNPGRAEAFAEGAAERGCKLDIGKGCVRFKRLEDIDLELVRQAVAVPLERFLQEYEACIPASKRKPPK